MNRDRSKGKRSAEQIKQSLDATREQIDKDLTALGERVERRMSLRRHVEHHPFLFAVAGAVVGFVILRRPTLLLRAVGRLAGLGAPLILSALLRSPSSSANPGTQSQAEDG